MTVIQSFASLIAFSRMYLFVDYPTDIIGGVIVGLIRSKIVLYFFILRVKGLFIKMGAKGV